MTVDSGFFTASIAAKTAPLHHHARAAAVGGVVRALVFVLAISDVAQADFEDPRHHPPCEQALAEVTLHHPRTGEKSIVRRLMAAIRGENVSQMDASAPTRRHWGALT
jgi:hypothetical protein